MYRRQPEYSVNKLPVFHKESYLLALLHASHHLFHDFKKYLQLFFSISTATDHLHISF